MSHCDFALGLGLPISALKFVFGCHSDCSPRLCRKELKSLEQSGSLKGSLSAEQQSALISGCVNLAEAVEGAMHIQVSQSQGAHGFAEARSSLPAFLESPAGKIPPR